MLTETCREQAYSGSPDLRSIEDKHTGFHSYVFRESSIHGTIYRALSTAPAYSHYLHDMSNMESGMRAFKKFAFSSLHGAYELADGNIRFIDCIKLEIRSCDPVFINILYQCFLRYPEVRLGRNTLYVSKIFVNHMFITTSYAAIEMKTPLVAYRTDEGNHTYFYSPDNTMFYQALERNAERKWEYITKGGRQAQIEITPLFETLPKMQKSVFKRTYITGWFGRYRLEGEPVLLNLLYDIGLGAKNPEGYGMFDYI